MPLRILITSLFWLLFGWCRPTQAQYPNHPLPQYPTAWNAQWITHPDIDQTAYNLVHFRKKLLLDAVPSQFVVHVSGDNRYRLYVNGQEVGYGPQLGDQRHWRYETYDLAPYLKAGSNLIAAEVMNWGVERSYGIMSFKTGFLVQGHSEAETALNTSSDNGWRVLANPGIYEKTVHWRGGGEIVGGFYAGNPMDSIVAEQWPWGWSEADFDDDNWPGPEVILSQPKTSAGFGHGWILQPRTTARQVSEREPFTRVARSSLDVGDDFRFGQQVLTVPANSEHTLLIDQGYVTLGFPKLTLSGGANASVKVKYSEALYDAENRKGHRNKIEGKVIKGISDVYVMDGGEARVFQPRWLRSFRFIQLDIQTQDEPLRVDDFYNVFSASPIPAVARFETTAPVYDQVGDLCWRGLRMCAQDNLMSDAYYETMQYVGDLRPHLKAWTALTGDLTYFKSAMEQFNNSRLPDGNVTSCYPLKATFVHPTYSLIWIDMLHDLMMLHADTALLDSYTGEIQEVFDYYESLINEHGLVGKSEYKMFIDWYVPKGGNSAVNEDGNSAILTLNYAYALGNAAKIMEWLGYRERATFYRAQARKYAEAVRRLCFDKERGIYADDPEQTFYDQRASILAVLTDAHTPEEKRSLMQRVLSEETNFDSRANLFYYFYLFEAMQQTGVGDFTKELEPWQALVDAGLTATPEKRVEQHPRSEVHPWTAHPVHYYFSLVAGIQPTSPGFRSVRIAPQPGSLERIAATYPTKQGRIELELTFDGDKARGRITLPEGVGGSFVWNGQTLALKPGVNTL